MVSGGLRHVKFWSTSGPTLRAKRGLYGKLEKVHSTTITRAVNHFYVPNHAGSSQGGGEPKGSFCLITSSLSGHIYRWEGRKRSPEPPLPACYPEPIHAMAAIGYSKETSRLVIGDNEGCVKVYGASLDKIVEYNLADLVDSVKPRDLGVASIRSVDIFGYSDARHPVDQHGCKILVGTLSSEVYEIKGPGLETSSSKIENLHNGALVQGHFKNGQTKEDEVWGLAIDPNSKNYFATAGDDNTVRIWSMGNRKMIACFALQSDGTKESARTVAWSKAFNKEGSSFLAVGLGGNVEGQKKYAGDGGVILLMVPPITSHGSDIHLTLLHRVSATDSGVMIRGVADIKFFVEFEKSVRVAVASQSGVIFVGEVDLEKQHLKFSKVGIVENDKRRASGHAGFANHIDFSVCGNYLQSNWASSDVGLFDLRFHKVGLKKFFDFKKEKVTGKTLCDKTYESWTCPLGWPVRGIWPAGADGTEINAVHRSSSEQYVAAADDFGKVKVFNYPCTVEGSPFVSGSGHSSRVTNVRFSGDDGNLITCGGNDRTVIQWKVDVTFDE
jgi:microtubule-associated protein-like 6